MRPAALLAAVLASVAAGASAHPALIHRAFAHRAARAPGTIEVPLSRNAARSLLTPEGLVNSTILSSQIDRLAAKYMRTFDSFLANTGLRHFLDNRMNSSAAIGARGKGTVPLGDQDDGLLWTGAIAFGTPPQNIYIDFDTGSSDTLVNPAAYDPSLSSTSEDTGTTFFDSYADGTSAIGGVYADELTIGGLSAPKAYIGKSNQVFDSGNGNSQGISGMAFPNLARFQQQEPWFYSLIKAGALDEQAFVMDLKEENSTMSIGTTAPNASWTPVTDAAYWSIDAKVNGKPIQAIVDSGTSLIVAPLDDAVRLYMDLGLVPQSSIGQVQASYDCSKPPSVSFELGGKSVDLGKYTSYGVDSTGRCVFSVIGSSSTGSIGWILGDSLFNANGPITFDVENKRVGF